MLALGEERALFIGHYGPAYAIKRWQPSIPVFVLFIAVQLMDVAWAVFVPLGIEKVRIVPGITASNPLDLYYMPYTHSLVASLGWAVLAGLVCTLIARRAGSIQVGIAVGLAVFSHWLLDLVVHRPDLPLYDNTAKVGFGLWNYRWPAFATEIGVLVAGLVLYLRGTRATDRIGKVGPWVFSGALVVVQAMLFFGTPPESPNQAAIAAVVSYFAFAGTAEWLDRHRSADPQPRT